MKELEDLKRRLAAVEQELALLKNGLPQKNDAANWVKALSGSMKDYPEFDEVIALGREARNADRPAETRQ